MSEIVATNIAQNLMFDRRVCRGSTFRAAAAALAAASPAPGPGRTKAGRRTKTRSEGAATPDPRPSTPAPVPGRAHAPAQTKSYLEVLDEGRGDHDQECQTEEIMDVPVPVVFRARPSGDSKATEIGPGDLFDFDAEVAATIEVLIGKTIDQALMDVVEETELAQIAAQQEQFEHMRLVVLAETQRLEARESRLDQEKRRRLRQARDRKAKEGDLARKLAARTVAKESLHAMNVAVLGNLASKGLFREPVQDQIEDDFMPWLANETVTQIETRITSRQVMESAAIEAVAAMAEQRRRETTERRSILSELQNERESQLLAQRQAEADAAAAAAAAAEAAARLESAPETQSAETE